MEDFPALEPKGDLTVVWGRSGLGDQHRQGVGGQADRVSMDQQGYEHISVTLTVRQGREGRAWVHFCSSNSLPPRKFSSNALDEGSPSIGDVQQGLGNLP